MANVTVKALVDFKYKGKQVVKGDEVSMPVHAASTYSNIDYVKLSAEVKEKVEASVATPEKVVGNPVTAKKKVK